MRPADLLGGEGSPESIAFSDPACYKTFTYSGSTIHLFARIIRSDSPPRGRPMPKRLHYALFVSHAGAGRARAEGHPLNALDHTGVRVYSEAALAITHFVRAQGTSGGHARWP